MSYMYLALVVASTAWAIAGIVAIRRVIGRRASARARTTLAPAPVSVLKPLCGADEALEANLATFFEQDHPDFELVFGIQGANDPALAVVRRLQAAYPRVRSRIVVHAGGRGINPKVSNLRFALDAAEHDVVVISDSNIAVSRTYLRAMVATLAEPRVGLVTSLFSGDGEHTMGAALESLHLAGAIAGGVAAPTELFGLPVAVGKSMMFRRSLFERLGGFEAVANVLAEDYVMGNMFHCAGYRVRLCDDPVRNVSRSLRVRAFVDRHLRWSMMRMRLEPAAFAVELLTVPLAVALLAPLFGVDLAAPLAWAIVITIGRDVAQWIALRGPRGLARALPLFPVRDALVVATWIATPFFRHVSWRGNRARLGAGTQLYAARRSVLSAERA